MSDQAQDSLHDLMTPVEVADLFRVTRKTVTRWDREGKFKLVIRTLGGHRRYSRAEVMEMLSRKVESDPSQQH